MLTKTVVHMGQKPILERLDIGAINEKTVSKIVSRNSQLQLQWFTNQLKTIINVVQRK